MTGPATSQLAYGGIENYWPALAARPCIGQPGPARPFAGRPFAVHAESIASAVTGKLGSGRRFGHDCSGSLFYMP